MPTIFIAGTDTGVGKTWVTVRLLKALGAAGHNAVGYKPVAAGCEWVDERWRNDDAQQLLAASSPGPSYAEINPYALREPIAPHLAARHQGVLIEAERIVSGAQTLAERHDWVLVEGAGGLCVPLNEHLNFLQLVATAGWPSVLVVGMRLGCLNHAFLSAAALEAAHIRWAWLANALPPAQACLHENHQCLQQALAAPEIFLADKLGDEAVVAALESLAVAGNRRFD